MSREFPGNTSPVGKPSIKARLTATPCGTLPIHTGHGTGYAQTTAQTSYPGKGSKSGATSKGGLTTRSGHGTGYGQESSRG
jgi:hypothetical protein